MARHKKIKIIVTQLVKPIYVVLIGIIESELQKRQMGVTWHDFYSN